MGSCDYEYDVQFVCVCVFIYACAFVWIDDLSTCMYMYVSVCFMLTYMHACLSMHSFLHNL